MAIALRPYQLHAVNLVRRLISVDRKKRIVLVLPTGAGKTIIAAYIIASAVGKGTKVLLLAHRLELINQCVAKLIGGGIPEEQISVSSTSSGTSSLRSSSTAGRPP